MELVTPVAFAKSVNCAPQMIYSMIKRGLPTHKGEVKGKERDLVDPQEAQKWIDDYHATKSQRQTAPREKDAQGNDIPRVKTYTGGLKKGDLMTYERMPGHAVVAKVDEINEEFVVLRKHMPTMTRILQAATERSYPMTHDFLRDAIRKQRIILDTPLQVIDYAISEIATANPDFAEDLRNVVTKHVNAFVNQQKMELENPIPLDVESEM